MTRDEMIREACRRTLTPFQLGAFASDDMWIGMLKDRFGREVVKGDRIKQEMLDAIRAEFARLARETALRQ
jgi:hypothetical protein